jgi:hypothetical protein
MKILMFYAPTFWFKTYEKVIENVPDHHAEKEIKASIVVFYHCESEDIDREENVLKKFLKNIKWLAGKFQSKSIVLHSFNHLSSSKAPPEFSRAFKDRAKERLINNGFSVSETPFGYLNEWKMHVAGESLAKVFKDL